MNVTASSDGNAALARLVQALRDWIAGLKAPGGFDHLERRDLERLAQDLGLTAADLKAVAGQAEDAADLLPCMMARLGLDPAAVARVDIQMFRDLQRVCTLCGSKDRCGRDLADPSRPADLSYCANSDTLEALIQAPDPAAKAS